MKNFPLLYVEGRDDQWAIQSLLEVNGIKLVKGHGPVEIRQTHSVDEMIDCLEIFIKASQSSKVTIGFVLDIDLDVEARWQAICAHLAKLDIICDRSSLTSEGAIIQGPSGSIGFWLMPDNQSHGGKLEDFLRTLVKIDNQSLPISQKYVKHVAEVVATDDRFRDVDVGKAEMSSWLAVQNPPGVPYGTAIKARILESESPVAKRFVSWFKQLYNL